MKKILDFNKRKLIISIIVAIVFAGIHAFCNNINTDFEFVPIDAFTFIWQFALIAVVEAILVYMVFTLFDKRKLKNKVLKIGKFELFTNNWQNFLITFIVLFLNYLPFLFKFYPGFLTYDSIEQVKMALGDIALTDKHPILHTYLISIFISFGKYVLNDINVGAALYSAFQILMMTLVFTTILNYIYRENSFIFKFLAFLYFMIYPINTLMGLEMWKDILFSAVLPIFVLQSYKLITNPKDYLNKPSRIAIFIAVSLLTCLLRHNGFYVVLLTTPFYMIYLRKYWKKVLLMFAVIYIAFFAMRFFYMNILQAKKTSSTEMLTIPVQQLARVHHLHKEELTEEENKEIVEFFSGDDFSDKYMSWLSDNMKESFKDDYFKENKIKFFGVWFKYLFKYPMDYIKSFLANTDGYYYIGTNANRMMIDTSIYPNDYGIAHTEKLDNEYAEFMYNLTEPATRKNPIISAFFNIGVYVWIMIIFFAYKFYQKDYRVMLVFVPLILLWLTCIAGPLNTELRYIYSFVIAIPMCYCFTYNSKDNSKEKAKTKKNKNNGEG